MSFLWLGKAVMCGCATIISWLIQKWQSHITCSSDGWKELYQISYDCDQLGHCKKKWSRTDWNSSSFRVFFFLLPTWVFTLLVLAQVRRILVVLIVVIRAPAAFFTYREGGGEGNERQIRTASSVARSRRSPDSCVSSAGDVDCGDTYVGQASSQASLFPPETAPRVDYRRRCYCTNTRDSLLPAISDI